MNVFEVLTVLGIIGAGYVCGKWLGGQWGPFGWITGAIIGISAAIGLYCAFRRFIGVTKKH